ncbi:hypothetical protein AB832_07180 [Flavobacteriaceae bacterium (ex Bugula neritina AB1)]|nr:hypothetical protein AB832_07180 [Flavobacteriaceae bacterium (ex Bugula neritina AB1)]
MQINKLQVTRNTTFRNSAFTKHGMLINYNLEPEVNKLLQKTFLMLSKKILTGINDLREHGLIINEPNIGKDVFDYKPLSNVIKAKSSMQLNIRNNHDLVDGDEQLIPIPAVHMDFELEARQEQALKNTNMDLSMFRANIEMNIRRVLEKLEDMLFNGDSTIKYGGNQLYGYTTSPSAIQHELTGATVSSSSTNNGWNSATADYVKDITDMSKKLREKGRYGDKIVYIASDLVDKLENDYSKNKGTNTIKERIEAISGILAVKETSALENGTIVMVELDFNTVSWVNVQAPVTRSHEESMFSTHYKTYAIGAPIIKVDYDGVTGVVVGKPKP